MIRSAFICAALALGLAACGAPSPSSDAPASSTAAAAADVIEIKWEDLMPEGEDARLEQLYLEFFQSFEREMAANQSSLSDQLSADPDPYSDEPMDLSMIQEGSELDTMTQIGTFNVVEALNGKTVRMPGYIVPLDFDAGSQHTEFLLVPYFGACLHSPPPPPNQIVYVTSDPAAEIPDIYEPVWLEGVMKTGRFDTHMADSAYELELSLIEPYEY